MINTFQAGKKLITISKAHKYFQAKLLHLSGNEKIVPTKVCNVYKMCLAVPTDDAWLKSYLFVLQRIYGLQGKEKIHEITDKILSYYKKKEDQIFKELNDSLQHHARKFAMKVFLGIEDKSTQTPLTMETAKEQFDKIRAELIKLNIERIEEARQLRYLGSVAVFEYAIIYARMNMSAQVDFTKLESELRTHYKNYKDSLKDHDISMLHASLYSNNLIDAKFKKIKNKKMMGGHTISENNMGHNSKIVIGSKSLENLYSSSPNSTIKRDNQPLENTNSSQQQSVILSLKRSLEDLLPTTQEKNLAEDLTKLTIKEVSKPELRKSRSSSSPGPAPLELKKNQENSPLLMHYEAQKKRGHASTKSNANILKAPT